MQITVSRFAVCWLIVNNIVSTNSEEFMESKNNIPYINSQKTGETLTSIKNVSQHPDSDHSIECLRADTENKSLKEKKKIIPLIEIEMKNIDQ